MLFIDLERLVAPFDRNDRICHRNVDHRVLSSLRERRTSDELARELIPLDDRVLRLRLDARRKNAYGEEQRSSHELFGMVLQWESASTSL